MPRSDSEDDSSKRKLIYDGSKGKWSVFNQEVTVHTMSSEVQTALWNGEAVEIADHDDPKDYDKYFKHGFSKAAAESVAAGNRYRTIENYQALVSDDKVKLYQWLFKHTKDEARDVVVSKGKDKIHEIMGGIQTLHGALKDAIVPEIEDAITKVKYWVPKGGNYETFNKKDASDKVPEDANMRKYFKGIDSMRKILIKHYPDKGNLDQYDAIQLSRITKNIILALPEKYTDFVTVMRFHYSHAQHEMVQRQKVTKAVVLAAVKESGKEGSTEESVEQAVSEAQDEVELANKFDIMKADNLPPYEMLRDALIKVQQDAELASNRAAKGSKIPAYNTGLRQSQQKTQKAKKVTGGCWDCSQPNCKRGHQGCRSPGELNFAPDKIREKHGLPPRQNNQKPKAQKNTNTDRGNGGSNTNKINKVCSFFRRDACTKGKNCKWLHPQGEQGKTRKVSFGNDEFVHEVGRSFVKHAMKTGLGKRKHRDRDPDSSDDERTSRRTYDMDEGEDPIDAGSDRDAAAKFLAKYKKAFQTFMVKPNPELQDELLTGKYSHEDSTPPMDVVQGVQALVGSVEQQVPEIAPAQPEEREVVQRVQTLVDSVEQQVSEYAPVRKEGLEVAQRVQALVGSVEQQVSEIAPVPSEGLVGKSTIPATRAVNTVVQSVPPVVPLTVELNQVVPDSLLAVAGGGAAVSADAGDGAGSSDHTHQIARDRDMAKALQEWRASDEGYDSMEEVDEPDFVTYADPVGIYNAKNEDGSYQLCSHGHPLRSHVDKTADPYGKGCEIHFENQLAAFTEIAKAGVELHEATLSCDCHINERKVAREKTAELWHLMVLRKVLRDLKFDNKVHAEVLGNGTMRKYAKCDFSCSALLNDMQAHDPLYQRVQASAIVDEHIVPGMRPIDHNVSALREAEIICMHEIMLKYGIVLRDAIAAGETAMPLAFVNLCKDMLQRREGVSKQEAAQAVAELDVEADRQVQIMEANMQVLAKKYRFTIKLSRRARHIERSTNDVGPKELEQDTIIKALQIVLREQFVKPGWLNSKKYSTIGGMRMPYLRFVCGKSQCNDGSCEERKHFVTDTYPFDNYDSEDALENPCYDLNGEPTLNKSHMMQARSEGATLRRVCCKPGTDILGGKTLFNVDIANFKCMTHQRLMNAYVGRGYTQETGQTFEVFRSDDYLDDVERPCVQVEQVLPRDDEGNIIDASSIKQLATHDLVNLINERGADVLLVRERLKKMQEAASFLAVKFAKIMSDPRTTMGSQNPEQYAWLQKVIDRNTRGVLHSKRQVDRATKELSERLHVYHQLQDLHRWILDCLEHGMVRKAYDLMQLTPILTPGQGKTIKRHGTIKVYVTGSMQDVMDAQQTQDQSSVKHTMYVSKQSFGAHGRCVGYDSCSGVAVTTNAGNLVYCNRSNSLVYNTEIQGVGGARSKIDAVGPMVVKIEGVLLKDGRRAQGYLVDPNAVLMHKASRDDDDLALFSQTMFKKLGMIFVGEGYRGLDIVRCKKTGLRLILDIQMGIQVLPTLPFDARKFRQNDSVKAYIEKVRKGTHSPIFFVNETTGHVVDQGPILSHDVSMVASTEEDTKDFREGAGCGTSEQGQRVQPASVKTTSAAQSSVVDTGEWGSSLRKTENDSEKFEPIVNWATNLKDLNKNKYLCLVVNEAALTPEQRARLWHWRMGHPSPQVPVAMTKRDKNSGMNVTHVLNEECVVCEKAKFRKKPHFRQALSVRNLTPPYWKIFIDMFGGQQQYGCPSVGGAIGGIVFVCSGMGAVDCKLYATKDQFPRLYRLYLDEVRAKDFHVRIVTSDTDIVLISKEVEEIHAEYGIVWRLASAGTPQENSLAENGVRRLKETSRALMLGAPHLPKNLWGLALKHTCWILFVKQLRANENKSPFECVHRRPPPVSRMSYPVFGCPLQYKHYKKPRNANAERTINAYFVGKDPPSVLVFDVASQEVVRVSPTMVSPHEYHYCAQPSKGFAIPDSGGTMSEVKGDEAIQELDEMLVPKAVQSAKGMHEAVQRVRSTDEVKTDKYFEDNQFADDSARAGKLEEAMAEVMAGLKRGSSKELLDLFRQMLDDKRKRVQVDPANIVTGSRKRKSAELETPERQQQERRKLVSNPAAGQEKLYNCKPGTRVRAKSSIFGAEYASEHPGHVEGEVVGKEKGGILRILWDDDREEGESAALRSHWKHVEKIASMTQDASAAEQQAYLSMCLSKTSSKVQNNVIKVMIAIDQKLLRREEFESNKTGLKYPKSFWECLVLKDWRCWVESIMTEIQGWTENETVKEVRIEDVEPDAPIIDLEELYLIKRSGKYKHRLYARGDQLGAEDYLDTKAHTIAAESMRLCFSLAVACGRKVRSGDVVTAYLQSEQRKTIYAYKPSYANYLHADQEDLATLRRGLLQMLEEKGMPGIRKLRRKNRHEETHVWELLKAVYGVPDAGNAFEQLKEWVFERIGAKRLWTDRAVYHITEKDPQGGPDRFVLLWSHTDDFGYFGSDDEIEARVRNQIDEHMKMEWTEECKDYTSVEVHQDLDRGIIELRQSKYWDELGKQYSQHGVKPPFKTYTPLPDGMKMPESTPEGHEKAKKLPYRELVGSLMYPAVMTKLEIRYAVSQLARFMTNWTEEHWNCALITLKYGITTRYYGVIYSRGLDKHGVNVLYAYADSSFTAPYSHGGHTLLLNGGAIINTSKKHPTIDISSTAAEFAELFFCAMDIKRMRNFLEEIGMCVTEPTLCYQDNQPAIKIAEGTKTAGAASTKAMNIRYSKVQEMIQDDQELQVKWLATADMVADLNSKALGRRAFEYLRDILTGYALVRMRFPKYFNERHGDKCHSWIVKLRAITEVLKK